MQALILSLLIAAPLGQSTLPARARLAQDTLPPAAPVCGKENCKCGCKDGETCTCASPSKSCPCSAQCECGCNEGQPCRCGRPVEARSAPAYYRPAPAIRYAPAPAYQTPAYSTPAYRPAFAPQMIQAAPRMSYAPARSPGGC